MSTPSVPVLVNDPNGSPLRPSATRRGVTLGRALQVAALTCAVGLSGCNRTSGSGAARDDLKMVPKETDVVLMVNLAQARKSPTWQRAVQRLSEDAKGRADYQDFARRCQLDPFTQIDSLFVALPSNISDSKEYAALLRGPFDSTQLMNCIRDISRDKGEPIVEAEHVGTKLVGIGRQPTFLAAVGKKVLALGGSGWIRRVAELSTGKGPGGNASDHQELQALIKRTRTGDTLWWSGLVPPSSTERLRNNPLLGPVRSLHSVSGSLDLSKGLAAHAYLDLGSEADATELKKNADTQLEGLRTQPALRMMGMVSFLNGVKTGAKGSTFDLEVELTQPQVDDLVNRVAGLSGMLGGGRPSPTMPLPAAPAP